MARGTGQYRSGRSTRNSEPDQSVAVDKSPSIAFGLVWYDVQALQTAQNPSESVPSTACDGMRGSLCTMPARNDWRVCLIGASGGESLVLREAGGETPSVYSTPHQREERDRVIVFGVVASTRKRAARHSPSLRRPCRQAILSRKRPHIQSGYICWDEIDLSEHIHRVRVLEQLTAAWNLRI